MPRPRGLHSADSSKTLAVRVPNALLDHIHSAAGAESGQVLAEWHRNALRRATGVPIDYAAGYEEGKAAGWADANERFKAALKASR